MAGLQQAERETDWRRTGLAARALGVHETTLKRFADRDHILIESVHWVHGPYTNSPRRWNVPLCREALAQRGRLTRTKRS